MIALGIAVAGAGCGALAVESGGLVRAAWVWTAVSCGIASAAYLLNRPAWLGKRSGRLTPRALVLLPYLVAFRIACAIIRSARTPDVPTEVVPGLWVAGRVDARSFPAGVSHVVDLVAEYDAPAWERALPGYRALSVLDGGQPPSARAFLDVVRDLRDVGDGVLVHCDSGRGRAPTMAAAILIARGVAPDVESRARVRSRATTRVGADPRRRRVSRDRGARAPRAPAAGRGRAPGRPLAGELTRPHPRVRSSYELRARCSSSSAISPATRLSVRIVS